MSEPTTGGVLVTAGASGIGLAVVRRFVAQGAKVATCDIDAEALARLRAEHPEVHATQCDVSDPHAVEQWTAESAERLGGVRHLISNAGIPGPTTELEHLNPEDWSRVLDVNLTGTFLVCRAAIPHLRRTGEGAIVIMSSLAGRSGYPGRSAYSASKWGLVGLTKTLSRELGSAGIRVNTVLPGAVSGPRWDGVVAARSTSSGRPSSEIVTDALRNQSIKELVTPQDVAALVSYLCSDDARRISGQSFPIDGDSQSAQ